jgi:nitrate/nitrite transporter NarK
LARTTGIGELRVLAIPILECRCSISLFLTGTAAAGAIALINATGNLGGFVGPFVVGWIKDSTNSFEAGLYFLAASALCGAIIAFLAPRASGKQSAIQPADPSVTPQAGH